MSFSPEADAIVYLHDVAPASTMTNEERASAWYTFEDMLHTKEQAKNTRSQNKIHHDRQNGNTLPPPVIVINS